ncbi:noncanonical pyrimidine nucleotidase, YjjG family [Winogradskyella sp. PC-19]|uniref:YjjG family noncanonical pyrimidine nucleotidase n=1 Tax=unclassified Winogradskyella TaxID=2615021 RepID=UPI000B3CB70F|nr:MULTISPECIES: YjjG family noncanonical pyrimidine nucleotidase [unclassified Winogradskyella]ARV09202.1 noncanonical pyrimidine nucleotidase, YjjG family [Winogradskyella sp. PC-19]RZN82521.1 MAG: noncanonical pyrimidine nucleotidase, YjjG family [Winogradskyella sp.]
MHKKIQHIFFDLDHTLWDFDKNSGLTFGKIFKIHDVDVALEDFLNVYEPINFKYWKLYREEQVTKQELRYGRLKEAFNEINMSVSDQLIDNLSEDYITYLSTFNHVFDGAHDVLDYLNGKYELHIITNGFEEAQEKKMKASNLKEYFNTVTNSEMVGVKKPNPKIFNFAMDLANAKPEQSVMIGDSLEADIRGAIGVGMEALYFDYKNSDYNENYHRITQLSTLKDLF